MINYSKVVKSLFLSCLSFGAVFSAQSARAAGPEVFIYHDYPEIYAGDTVSFWTQFDLPDGDIADPNYTCYIYLEDGTTNGIDITDDWTIDIDITDPDQYCTGSWTTDYDTPENEYQITAELYQNDQLVNADSNWVYVYNTETTDPPIDPPVDPPVDPPTDPEITTVADTWLSPDQTIDSTTTTSTNIILSFALSATNAEMTDCSIMVSDAPDSTNFTALGATSEIITSANNYLFGTCSATWNVPSGGTGNYTVQGYFVDQDGTTWEAWPVIYTLLPKDTAPNITEPRLEITYNNGEKYNACMNLPTNKTLTINIHVALPTKITDAQEYRVKSFISRKSYEGSETYDSHITTGLCGPNWVCYDQPLDNVGSYTVDPEITHEFSTSSELKYHEVTVKLLRHIAGAGYDTNKASDYETVKVTVFNNIGTFWANVDSSVGWVYLTDSGCANPAEYTPPGKVTPTGKTGGSGEVPKINIDSSKLIGGTIHKISDLFGSLFGNSTRTGILMILIGAGALIGLLYTGFIFLTADGDEKKIEQAKKSAVAIVIGLVAGTLSYIIIFTVVGIIKRFQ